MNKKGPNVSMTRDRETPNKIGNRIDKEVVCTTYEYIRSYKKNIFLKMAVFTDTAITIFRSTPFTSLSKIIV